MEKAKLKTDIPEISELYFDESEKNYFSKNYLVSLANFFSHLGNYQTPVDPSLCHFISGKLDMFYGPERMTHVKNVWHGVEVFCYSKYIT